MSILDSSTTASGLSSVSTSPSRQPSRQPSPNTAAVGLIEDHILPRLDPVFLRYVVDVVSKQPPNHLISLDDARAHPEKYRPPIAQALAATNIERVSDHVVSSQDGASIDVRVYHPDPAKFGPGPYPVHMNHHGGGFVMGDLWTEAELCVKMREAGVVIVDVNYRHCPETIWGKCIQDAWAALNWARDSSSTLNINPTLVSIGGVSAGAHISLVLQHMARDAGIPLKLCLASVPPSTDGLGYRYYTDSPFASFHEFNRDPILPWKRIQYFGSFAMPQDKLPELRKLWPDWWFAPIRATNWTGLCDTYIRTAEIDPLRDEGEAYGMKLVAGGAKVTFKRYGGCPHTFMYMPFMKQKDDYDQDAIEALRIAHGTREISTFGL